MIGKSLRERHTLAPLSNDAATSVMTSMLTTHAAPIVEVRAKDPRMVAVLVAHADEASARLCKSLGFRVTLGASLVFGLVGTDAVQLLGDGARVGVLTAAQRAWLSAPCGPRETKVVLLAAGFALLSLEAKDGQVTVVSH